MPSHDRASVGGDEDQRHDEHVCGRKGRDERRDQASEEAVGRVESEVLRQSGGAVVAVAELAVEVADRAGVAPPLDRHRVDLDQAPGCDCGRADDDHRADPPELRDDGAAEEVRRDEDQVVSQAVRDRAGARVPVERALGDHRVEDDDRAVGERERVEPVGLERQAAVADGTESDGDERRREHDLLPCLDRVERAAAHAAPVEERHDDVVQRQAECEEVQRDHRPPEDGDDGRGEQDAVDGDGGGGHCARASRRKRSRLRL